MFRIEPAVQRYDWGDPHQLPELLGFTPDGGPYAEAWWGAHGAAPALADGKRLDDVIAAAPGELLGERVVNEFGRLPFLLKVLAISKPLSIQVHPTRAQTASIQQEYAGGDSPLADDWHKPELVVALSPMRLQSGFRPMRDTAADLRILGGAIAERLADVVDRGEIDEYVETVLTEPDARELLDLLAAADLAGHGSPVLRAAANAARIHPGDPGALVSLALNVVELQPGQGLYTGAGVMHCFHSGLGLEIMANSDNVLRAGLTTKPINVPLVLELATPLATEPALTAQAGDETSWTYLSPAQEFQLMLVSEGAGLSHAGPRIVLAVDGAVRIDAASGGLDLAAGQAAFVADADGPITVTAQGMAAVASVPPAL